MYTLYVNSVSPYSAKVSALIGYSGLACKLSTQNAINRYTVIKKLTGRTAVPMLRDGDWALSDSTHIAQHVMALSARPMLPQNSHHAALCWLLEDFADEWVVRWVLYSRWTNRSDSDEVSRIIGNELAHNLPGLSSAAGRLGSRAVKKSIEHMGVRASNAVTLENSRDRLLNALDVLLNQGPLYLFEGYPSVADFALYGALGQYFRDPSGRARMLAYPALRDYLERLDAMRLPAPDIEIALNQPSRQASSLQPLFAELMGTYWQMLVANFRAISRAKNERQVRATMLDGSSFSFASSNYLVGRLKQMLTLIDETYRGSDELFGEQGLRLESAIMAQIAHLSHHSEGRELLRDFPHLGLH
ncbi:MAG: glutathione S-transferase N-terminal domain-containing protein [Bradymonadaceae bacterium]|nr:glutathione S-transferase N-terminal domain-containing protein [Lujinxingiaceae bacterium]